MMPTRTTLIPGAAPLAVATAAAPALADGGGLPPALDAMGRLHFLLLHFPIAILVLVLAMELVLRRRAAEPAHRDVTAFMLAIAMVGAVTTTATGLVHAAGEAWPGHTGTMLAQHRAGGIATALLTVATWLAQRRSSWRRAYMPLLCASVLGVALTGHRGGDLVHGEGYLLEAFNTARPAGARPDADDDQGPTVVSDGEESAYEERPRWPEGEVPARPDYVAHIKPIFERSCLKCHGPEKRKGGLRLDKKRFAMKGGETGPALVPGAVAESLLIKYVTLPVGDEDLMPPRGKLLAQSEIETLKRWVEQGGAWPDDA